MSNIQRVLLTISAIANHFNVDTRDIEVDDSGADVIYRCTRTPRDLADDLFNSEGFQEFCETNDLHGAFDFNNYDIRFTFGHKCPKPVQAPVEPTFTRAGLLDMLKECNNLEDLLRAERKLIDVLYPPKEGE